jgi:hypothetical protein
MNTTSSVNRLNQFDDMDLRTGATGVPFQRGADPNRVTPDQVKRARIVVARNASDTEDCRRLLDMLGLLEGPDGGQPPVCR